MQEMNSTVQHCIWADLTRWEGLGTLKCSSLFYVTNLPLLQIKTHCSVIRIYWIEPFSSNIFLHGSWLWERCIAWFLALREMYQVWFVIVRLHLKLRLNNSIFLVGVTSEGGKCLSAKVMFTTCRILNIPNGVDLGKSLVWAWKESNVASFNTQWVKGGDPKFFCRWGERAYFSPWTFHCWKFHNLSKFQTYPQTSPPPIAVTHCATVVCIVFL